MPYPIDDHLQFAIKHVHDLFVRVRVLRQDRAGLDVPLGKAHVVRMNETAVKAGHRFAAGQSIKAVLHRTLPLGMAVN